MLKSRIDKDLELSVLEERHADQVYALIDEARPYLREWLPFIDTSKSVDSTKEFIKKSLKQYADNQGSSLGIWYKGELAGIIGLHWINWDNKYTSIGYWLGERFQGKGIMSRACKALIDHCFDELNLNRIEIRVATGNLKSQAVPKRLGFTHEGILRSAEWINDRYVDHIVYGLLKSDK
jgi:ribosomal-protein-serine acetyltransferase